MIKHKDVIQYVKTNKTFKLEFEENKEFQIHLDTFMTLRSSVEEFE